MRGALGCVQFSILERHQVTSDLLVLLSSAILRVDISFTFRLIEMRGVMHSSDRTLTKNRKDLAASSIFKKIDCAPLSQRRGMKGAVLVLRWL